MCLAVQFIHHQVGHKFTKRVKRERPVLANGRCTIIVKIWQYYYTENGIISDVEINM
jgi:hypothetical protein